VTAILKPWQERNAARLLEIYRSGAQAALDASDTGSGKTFCACGVAKALIERKPLVITPKSVMTSWRRVMADFDLRPRDVLNVEKLKTGKTLWLKQGQWQLPPDTFLIWDEVHKGASGPKTQTTQLLALTKAYKIPVLMLSATVADSPLKMRAIGYLLGLHQYNEGSFYSWCRKHGCYMSPFHRGLDFTKGPTGQAAMLRIHEAMKPFMVRTRIDEIPEFPECDTQAELYDLDMEYRNEINAIYAEMDEALQKPHANPMTERLRARQRTELLKVPLLVDLANEAVEEGRSVVLFVGFRETLAKLAEALAAHGVSTILGRQKEEDRTKAMDAFQLNDHRVCVAMIQAGGVGVSLHDVKHERPRTAYITPSDSSVEIKQCLGRIHRVGGTKAVQQFVLISETVEEKVYNNITNKLSRLDALNDGDLAI